MQKIVFMKKILLNVRVAPPIVDKRKMTFGENLCAVR
jgi:hypothetical protein